MTFRRATVIVILAVACLAATLAIPVRTWRTGRLSVPPLTLTAPDAQQAPGRRVWIDTDAACGHTPYTDVDDCLALWLLAATPGLDVAGVSTVFGNAPLEITNSTTQELARMLPWAETVKVYRGARGDLENAALPATPVSEGLIRALEAGPLTIVALGPLTNVARALETRPDLQQRVNRLVAVMGRRIGHLFHPSEGSGRGTLLGHGPVFRDFNFSMDPQAARAVVAMNIPTTLIPYDAARHIEITSANLRELATAGDAGRWIASRSQGWLQYWRTEIGRSGFYPFDLMAAAHVIDPSLFRCANVRAWVGTDPLLFLPLFRPEAFLVEQHTAGNNGYALYCPDVQTGFDAALRKWLGTDPAGSAPGPPLATIRSRSSKQPCGHFRQHAFVDSIRAERRRERRGQSAWPRGPAIDFQKR